MYNYFIIIIFHGLLSSRCEQNDKDSTDFDHKLENRLLKELQLDLTQNLGDINSNIESLKISENANRMMIDHMDNNIPYNDSLGYHVANLYPFLVFSPNETTYNLLKQNGMFLISNDSIRSAVSDLYDVQYGIYKSYESIYFVEQYTNYIKPMFIKEFEIFKFFRSFKLRYYIQFIKNKEYKRIMSYTADASQTFRFMQLNL